MTRECNCDFKELKNYITAYRISGNLDEEEYLESLKSMHRCYFSTITWHAEMTHRKDDFLSNQTQSKDEILSRISEAVSDIGSSYFNWINGGYKTAKVMLRAAIENFVRAISSIDDGSQLTEKNVYTLFDKADCVAIFNRNESVKKMYIQLHADYKVLCEDAHTATTQNMEHLSSLAGLPVFKKKKAQDTRKIFIRVLNNMTGIFCILFNDFYHNMHYRNKENILNSLSRKIKSIVHDINV
jgi:hypothetical protein